MDTNEQNGQGDQSSIQDQGDFGSANFSSDKGQRHQAGHQQHHGHYAHHDGQAHNVSEDVQVDAVGSVPTEMSVSELYMSEMIAPEALAEVVPEVVIKEVTTTVTEMAQTVTEIMTAIIPETLAEAVPAIETAEAAEVSSTAEVEPSAGAAGPVASVEYSLQSAVSPAFPAEKQPSDHYFNNSIFWIEIEKVVPNPYQPRREFDPQALRDLSESIRMYGLLQPLVVTRREIITEDGGMSVRYELISGERRLRASKLGGLSQVPVIIRAGEEDARVKLELAIIENLQREDLNSVDRARSFQRLAEEFGLKHVQIAEKMGKSREYVTNTIRLLALPEHMLVALSEKKITEGHTRPLLMLIERPEEQEVLFKEIIFRKMTVREAEAIARRVAVDRARKKDKSNDPEIVELEAKLNRALGTRVIVERKEKGGKVVIDFFDNNDLRHLLDVFEQRMGSGKKSPSGVTSPIASPMRSTTMPNLSASQSQLELANEGEEIHGIGESADDMEGTVGMFEETDVPLDDSTPADLQEDEDMYSIKNFSI